MVCGLGRCVLVEPHPLLLLMTKHPASAFLLSHPPPLVSVKSLTIGGIKRRKTHTTHSHSISLFFCTRTKSQAETQMPIARPQPHTNHSETLSSAVRSSMSHIFSFTSLVPSNQPACLLGRPSDDFILWMPGDLLRQSKWWMNWVFLFVCQTSPCLTNRKSPATLFQLNLLALVAQRHLPTTR